MGWSIRVRAGRRVCGATVVAVLLAGCGAGDDTALEVTGDATTADTAGAAAGTDSVDVVADLDTVDELSSALVEVIDRLVWIVESGAGEPSAATTGDRVEEGDVVVTDEAGFGELVYADGSFTRVGPDTVMEVTRLQSTVKTSDVNVGLEIGRTFHVVGELTGRGRFEVATAVGLTAVRGTAFAVVCLVPRTCTVVVVDGEVEVTPSGGAPIVVRGGEQVTIDEQGAEEVVPAQPDPWVDDNVERGTEPHDPPDSEGQQAAPGSQDEGEPVARPASLNAYMPPSTSEPVVLYADLDDDGVEEIVIGTFDAMPEDSNCGTAYLVLLAYDRTESAWLVQHSDEFEFASVGWWEVRVVDVSPSTADQQVAWNMRRYGCGTGWFSATTVVAWDGASATSTYFEGLYAMQSGLVELWTLSDSPDEQTCVLALESWDGTQLDEVDVRVVDCTVALGTLSGSSDSTFEELFAPVGTEVVLDDHGLGVVFFGRLMDDAMAILTEALGPPTGDTTYTSQPGDEFAGGYFADEVREVGFAGVSVLFQDTGYRYDGRMNFAGWRVGGEGTPYRTPEGITVGSTVDEVRAAYGYESVPNEEDPCGGDYWFFATGVRGMLSGHPDDPATRVAFMTGGVQGAC